MESFYGGKKGASFVIAKSYKTVAAMEQDFSSDSSGVKYDEYVLINTENKSDSDNGKLYRRGYQGAEYVGTIVGPTGGSPQLTLTTIDNAQNIYDKMQNTEGGSIGTSAKGSYTVANAGLVPGKTSDGEYVDEIEWYSCSLQTAGSSTGQAFIGFKIPYPVIEFTAEIDSSGGTSGDLITKVKTEDGKTHPFYQQWHLKIPQGIQGNSFNNLRVITADKSIKDYEGKQEDMENGSKVFVYDWYNTQTNTTTPIYLGDYNMIKGLYLTNDGTLTIKYTHDTDSVFAKKIKWITGLTLNSDTGDFTVTYNFDTDENSEPTKYTSNLHWVNGMSIDQDGTVSLKYTGDKEDVTLTNKLQWVTGIDVTSEGAITIKHNYGEDTVLSNNIKWIKDINLKDGKLTVSYNNGDPDYTATLKWPTSFDISGDGTITIGYNTGESTIYTNYIKTIKNITLDNSTDENNYGTQKFKISYNTGGEPEEVGEPINFINKMAIREDDFHLLVLYSDKAKGDTTYNNIKGWFDLGSIRDYSGLLIGPKIEASSNPTQFANTETTIAFLNSDENYKNGFSSQEDRGKILTVNDLNGIKQFYAYDYGMNQDSKKEWYYLGNLTDPLRVVATSDSAVAEALEEGGLWFVIEDSIYGV
jgi:hypothetical protein